MFDGLLQRLLSSLRGNQELLDIEFLEAFPHQRQNSPLAKKTAAFRVERVKILPVALGDPLGAEGEKRAEASLELTVYSPAKLGGPACTDAFSRICSALIFGDNGACLHSISCEKTVYDASAGAFRITGSVGVTAYLVKQGGA